MLVAVAETQPKTLFYLPQGNECALFEQAFRNRLPLLLKGPTGSGKTRFIAHMAARLGVSLTTIACHDDLTAADLTGRYLLRGGDTVWVDGPLTRAVRHGGICYLDEVVEARKDVAVVLHPLTDDRRILPLDRTGEVLTAPNDFMLVASYNPGYQNVLKSLKPSTRQRFIALDFSYPSEEAELTIIASESGLATQRCRPLVLLAQRLRNLADVDLEEGCSTRLLVYAATLIAGGMSLDAAVLAAMIEPLTDDIETRRGLLELAQVTLG